MGWKSIKNWFWALWWQLNWKWKSIHGRKWDGKQKRVSELWPLNLKWCNRGQFPHRWPPRRSFFSSNRICRHKALRWFSVVVFRFVLSVAIFTKAIDNFCNETQRKEKSLIGAVIGSSWPLLVWRFVCHLLVFFISLVWFRTDPFNRWIFISQWFQLHNEDAFCLNWYRTNGNVV